MIPVALKRINRQMCVRLSFFALLMFGFGYAMVPYYKKFCEVTGINNLLQRDRKSTRLNSSHIPLSRMPSSA